MLKKVKALLFLPNFYMGGAEKVTMNMIRAIDTASFELHIVVLSKEGFLYSLLPQNITLHILESRKVMLSIFKLRTLIKEIAPDLIYSTLFRTHIALEIALCGLKERPKTIYRNPTSPKLVIAERRISFLELICLKIVYNRATLVISQTPEMKEEIAQYFHVKEEKIEIFINPLDTVLIKKEIANIENPFCTSSINVVSVGRLAKEKAFDVLLYAFKLVVQENRKFMLHLIGRDAGEKDSLVNIIKKLGIEENVKFWGEQMNPYRFYVFSDLYVMSSIREGLPNTILENLYLKKPIVATKCIPFMNQLIDHGNNGFLVEVGNIQQLADAILNFENLSGKGNDVLIYHSDANELFLKVAKTKL